MAAKSEGYLCEFIDSVPDDLCCKQCGEVARELRSTSCCGGSFCHTCIEDSQAQGQPCPMCGENGFTVIKHVKNQKRINGLQVYCIMKEKGCVWSGTLDQLDTHLDSHLDNCQYVDTKCPLNCLQTVPKNKVDQHVAEECSKRPHVCQHCGFKATYEEVVDTHLPKCKYVPLQCPNMCGVSCEREVMEDHMKICHLEEEESEFSSVGCDSDFIREDHDEHARKNSQKHLMLKTASLISAIKQSILEQHSIHKEVENKLQKTISEQKKQLEEKEKIIHEQAVKLEKLLELEKKDKEIWEPKQMLQKMSITSKQTEQRIFNLLNTTILNRTFEIKNFSIERAKYSSTVWKSPAMYTHMWGYKFCIGVDTNSHGFLRWNCVSMSLWSMSGEFDSQLNWPVQVTFTVDILNKQGEADISITEICSWNKPTSTCEFVKKWYSLGDKLSHFKLHLFLLNDTLRFHVRNVEI